MLQVPFSRRLSWVIAAAVVLSLPVAQPAFAAATSSATQMLSSALPPGVTLSKANFKQTSIALHDAVAMKPKMAPSLVEAAIVSKGKKSLTCSQVRSLVKTAISAAPSEERAITEMAAAVRPDCAEDLTPSAGNGILGSVGNEATEEATGFGAGLGAGFPGSPGFIGSAPSGAFTGITNPAVTSTTNP